MSYEKVGWSETTPINVPNLKKMDEGISNLNILGEIASSSGSAVIGDIGIEWGTVEVTSGESGTSSQGTTLYVGTTPITFKNKYSKISGVLTGWRSGYFNQASTYANSVSNTGCNIGGFISSANSTRSIGYFVVGQVN